MDIQVNKEQLDRVVIKWLNKNFGNLTPKKDKNDPNSVFYVNSNNKVMMEYDKKNKSVYIHNDHIWSKIQSLFHLNYDDTQSIMKVWLEETYKLEGVTPANASYTKDGLLEETYKLGGFRPYSA
jgi:hypothetical protein